MDVTVSDQGRLGSTKVETITPTELWHAMRLARANHASDSDSTEDKTVLSSLLKKTSRAAGVTPKGETVVRTKPEGAKEKGANVANVALNLNLIWSWR